eukprot:362209-Chlamydomonas_euryale.AAC.10
MENGYLPGWPYARQSHCRHCAVMSYRAVTGWQWGWCGRQHMVASAVHVGSLGVGRGVRVFRVPVAW